MLIFTLIDSQWARYLDHSERPGRDSVRVTLKVASSIPNEESSGGPQRVYLTRRELA